MVRAVRRAPGGAVRGQDPPEAADDAPTRLRRRDPSVRPPHQLGTLICLDNRAHLTSSNAIPVGGRNSKGLNGRLSSVRRVFDQLSVWAPPTKAHPSRFL